MSCRAWTPQPFLPVLKSWSLILEDATPKQAFRMHIKAIKWRPHAALLVATPHQFYHQHTSHFSVLATDEQMTEFFLLVYTLSCLSNTWVRFARHDSCRSSNRSMHGYTQIWEEAPHDRTQEAGSRSIHDQIHTQYYVKMYNAYSMRTLSLQTFVLTLSYQQRRLSCPHMQMLEEQSSLQTQYYQPEMEERKRNGGHFTLPNPTFFFRTPEESHL